jgi:hypothetical protein
MNQLTPASGNTPKAPFIKVYHDPDTGRTIIALDAAATDALDSYLDGFDAGDFLSNYGGHDDPHYIAQADAVSSIRAQLNKHIRGY